MFMDKWRWKIAQLAEINWWRWYLRDKPNLGYRQQKQQYWQQLISRFDLMPEPGARVLDAGCGPAGIFMVLSDYRVDALDPLLGQYEANLDAFDPSLYPNTQFLRSKLEDFDAAACYDVVFCMNAINHVDDLERSMDKLIDSLKPGGKLVMSVDVHRKPLLQRLFHLIPGDVLHPQQYDEAAYELLLQRRNMHIQSGALLKRAYIFDYRLLIAYKAAIS